MKNRKRIQWLDFAKGLMILSVVLLHSVSAGNNTIYSHILYYVLATIAMPAFFAISGYLYKSVNNFKQYKILLYKKITSFVIPYIAFTILMLIWRVATNRVSFILNHNYLFPITYLWFLYALFFIFIIVGFMDLCHISIFFQVIISIIFMFGQMFLPYQSNSLTGDINPLAAIGGYMICFYIGYIIKRYRVNGLLKKKEIDYFLIIVWLLLMIIQISKTGIIYNSDLVTARDFITKILSIPLLFALFIKYNKKKKLFKYFDRYGKYTLIIYLVHFPIVKIMSVILINRLRINSLLFILVLTLLGWYASIIACKLSNRFSIINFIFYPRKYINKIRGLLK